MIVIWYGITELLYAAKIHNYNTGIIIIIIIIIIINERWYCKAGIE